MLSPEQIKFYQDNGYIGVENVFSATEIAALRRVTDEFVEKSRGVTKNDDVFDLEPTHTPETPQLRRLKNTAKLDPVYRRTLEHPKMLDIVAQLIGPGIHYNGDKLNMKIGGVGSPVEWHQDWAFYPHTNDDLLAAGITLDDSTLENGCLLVLPGTHKGRIYDHSQEGLFVGAITEDTFRPDGAVPIELKAGGVSFHHVRVLHGSAPNRSPRPRRLLLFQFCAADAWPLMAGENFWETYVGNFLRGRPTNQPRLTNVPVRLPRPRSALPHGSIYETQTVLKKRTYQPAT
ncbi:MAG: phytanoyl-CoA dioxygenase family protein [Opitutaceae bacterium]|nr:phytanoyl-CoA dioxygenase family protein [Opitutaceae bacterium]